MFATKTYLSPPCLGLFQSKNFIFSANANMMCGSRHSSLLLPSLLCPRRLAPLVLFFFLFHLVALSDAERGDPLDSALPLRRFSLPPKITAAFVDCTLTLGPERPLTRHPAIQTCLVKLRVLRRIYECSSFLIVAASDTRTPLPSCTGFPLDAASSNNVSSGTESSPALHDKRARSDPVTSPLLGALPQRQFLLLSHLS